MAKIRILIVDDQVDAGEILKLKLQRLNTNYEVILVVDAFEALDMLRSAHFDVVITDYMMPGMDGLELIESVRTISPKTNVIMMSALEGDTLKEVLSEASVEHFLAKPFRADDIHRIVEQVLTQVEAARFERDFGTATISFKESFNKIKDALHELRYNVGGFCCFIVDASGFLMAQDGGDEQASISMLASLTAANGLATTEISRLLGNSNPFQSMIFEGQDYNVASYLLEANVYLSIVFGKHVRVGLVQHYARQSIATITPLLKSQPQTAPKLSLPDSDLADSIDSVFDDLMNPE